MINIKIRNAISRQAYRSFGHCSPFSPPPLHLRTTRGDFFQKGMPATRDNWQKVHRLLHFGGNNYFHRKFINFDDE